MTISKIEMIRKITNAIANERIRTNEYARLIKLSEERVKKVYELTFPE